jgi:hypothetical protein
VLRAGLDGSVRSRSDHGLSEVAQSLGVSVNAAKTQIQCVYEKTGAHRQADLTRPSPGGLSSTLRR